MWAAGGLIKTNKYTESDLYTYIIYIIIIYTNNVV